MSTYDANYVSLCFRYVNLWFRRYMENNTAFTPIVDRCGLFCCRAYWPALADWMSRSAFPPITGLWFSLLAILFPLLCFPFSCHKPYADKMVNKWICAGVKRHLYPLTASCPGGLFFCVSYLGHATRRDAMSIWTA